MFRVRDQVKEKIMIEFVEKSYESDICSLIDGRRQWKKTGQAFETMSKIFLALGGIMSFSSGYFDISVLSFLSGSVSVISLACMQFSSFCYLENKKQSNELNILLKKLGLDTMPELSRDNENMIMQKYSPNYVETAERAAIRPAQPFYIDDLPRQSNLKQETTRQVLQQDHNFVESKPQQNGNLDRGVGNGVLFEDSDSVHFVGNLEVPEKGIEVPEKGIEAATKEFSHVINIA
jgi:hypothetical protein